MPAPTPRSLLRRGAITVALNSAIALALTVFGRHKGLDNLLYAQAIGLSIWLLIEAGLHWWVDDVQRHWRRVVVVVPTGVLLGYMGGTLLGDWLIGETVTHFWRTETRQALGFLILSLAAGVGATWFFLSREQLSRARLAHEEAQRQASEARLQLLQSQLEPHMLFNTLANLRALIAVDPPRAIDMLDHLNGFLRATLQASRSQSHPLATEFDRLRDYLSLMGHRMGPRLRHALVLPPELASHPVPPLLLQPLVENSIRHGLEPAVQGGEVSVRAHAQDHTLWLEVQDNGVGRASAPTEGFGLAQVRERLNNTYGARAILHWESTPGQGTRVRLQLPLGTP